MRKYSEEYSMVRVLHGVNHNDAVDIYINDSLFFKALRFTQFSPYVYVPKGQYEMTVYNSDTTDNPLVREYIEVENGELTTIAITGDFGDLKLVTIDEDKEKAQKGYSKVRVVQLSPDTPEINILLDGKILFSDIEFRDITDYEEIQPSTYRMDIESSDGNRIIRSNRIIINADRIYTLYILGKLPNIQVFQSLDGATFISPSTISE